jgi:hypothetical protein
LPPAPPGSAKTREEIASRVVSQAHPISNFSEGRFGVGNGDGFGGDVEGRCGILHFSLFFASGNQHDLAAFIFLMALPSESENSRRFFPSGAIFFFVLLLLFYAAIWFTIYWIMISRS